MSPTPTDPTRALLRRTVLTAIVAAVATIGVTALLVNIAERKQEARQPFYRVVEITEDTQDPAVWAKNFPYQYDGYRRTVDMVRTRYGGSEAVSRAVTTDDPREETSQSRLQEEPRLRIMWAGYAFSKDFREERGHAFMLEDQTFTERQRIAKQPGTCIHCHASTYVAMRTLGGGDLRRGFNKLNKMSYAEARRHVTHPVACIDCHDPQTMALRVTRPAFLEGLRAKRAAEGLAVQDPNTEASRQEMRTYVCAQCHVEYYFRGSEKTLVYPWTKGVRADQILAYYDEAGFRDWVHAETEAPSLKVQHPEYEMWSQGTHGQAGVACADCHMPYTRLGAMKVSDHHIRSPLLNISNACQTCHRVPEDDLRQRAETIQGSTFEMRDIALEALMELIRGIKAARQTGEQVAQIEQAQLLQRRAQFFLDFVEAENSMGFHAPQESARVLLMSVDAAHRGRMALAGVALDPAAPESEGQAEPEAGTGGAGQPLDIVER